MVDRQILGQILDNLVSNAVKFSPRGKTIHVRVDRRQGRVRLEVRDEGPGLTEQDRERLFKRFARLSARPTGGEGSTGLGLSIVAKLAELLGARITCESEPGKGATFTLELPERPPA
jgi:signal transduction histidine kinase